MYIWTPYVKLLFFYFFFTYPAVHQMVEDNPKNCLLLRKYSVEKIALVIPFPHITSIFHVAIEHRF